MQIRDLEGTFTHTFLHPPNITQMGEATDRQPRYHSLQQGDTRIGESDMMTLALLGLPPGQLALVLW